MLTYLNEYGKRVEVKNKEHANKWHEIDAKMMSLSDEDYERAYEIIEANLWSDPNPSKSDKRWAERLTGYTMNDLTMWAAVDEF